MHTLRYFAQAALLSKLDAEKLGKILPKHVTAAMF
jgi:hypothetical protein